MQNDQRRLKIVPVHGESLFHVVDKDAPEGEQPAIVFTGHTWAEAEGYMELGVAG